MNNLMEVKFQNIYSFGITLGIIFISFGVNLLLLEVTSWVYIPLMIIGLFFLGFSAYKGFFFQRDIEQIQKRELADLQFDIDEVFAENEFEWEPYSFRDDGVPADYKEVDYAYYKIGLNVYNPGSLQNIVKNIEVEIYSKKNKKKLKCSKIEFSPQKIPPADYISIKFKAELVKYNGVPGDEITIKIFPLNNEKGLTKKFKIKRYYKGDNLREVQPDFH